jgi:hypothetical protein
MMPFTGRSYKKNFTEEIFCQASVFDPGKSLKRSTLGPYLPRTNIGVSAGKGQTPKFITEPHKLHCEKFL